MHIHTHACTPAYAHPHMHIHSYTHTCIPSHVHPVMCTHCGEVPSFDHVCVHHAVGWRGPRSRDCVFVCQVLERARWCGLRHAWLTAVRAASIAASD